MTSYPTLQNPLALIIEDDEEQLRVFLEALRMAEFEPETVRDGQAALTRLAEIEPVVVVLDLHLPGVAGREILRRIRADQRLRHTRVILATADHHAANLVRDEADLVLLKPISFIQLRDLASRLRPRELM